MLSLESFAVTRFLASDGRAKGVIGPLQLLGKFYADKYRSDDPKSRADFERALYCYTEVHKKSDREISALNDLGWLLMVVAQPRNPEKAKELFVESLRVNSKQQRPLYNLGTMVFDPRDAGKLSEARGYLERAVEIANWEKAPNEDNKSRVYYNLACTYSRLAALDGGNRPELLKLAVEVLDKAADKGGTAKDTLDDDFKEDGDLAALNQSPDKVATIRQKFASAWAARGEG
jgi:tetratricopeptide (TPR) repeat protein